MGFWGGRFVVSRLRFPWGSRGGKWETPPQRPAAARFRFLVSGHTLKNRRIPLKCASFQLPWGVSAGRSSSSKCVSGQAGAYGFPAPAPLPQINRPAARQVKFRAVHRDWVGPFHWRLSWRGPDSAAHVLWWFIDCKGLVRELLWAWREPCAATCIC
jgi:hypothetical protein